MSAPTRPEDWDARPGSAFAGARWHAFGQGSLQIVRLTVSLILVRLVSPSDFGVMAIALSVTEILEVVKDLGTGRLVVQREELPRPMYDSIFTLNLLLGLTVATVMALGSHGIAFVYGEMDVLPEVLQVLALTFFVSAISQAQSGLLTRRLAFGRLAVASLAGAVTNGAVAITLAFQGRGVWALVLGHLSGVTANTIVIWILNPWRPRLRLRWDDMRSIAHFTLHLTGSNILTALLGRMDTLILTRFLGTSATGYFAVARRIVAPIHTLARILQGVVNPALARIQGDLSLLRKDFLRATAGLALVISPMLIGVALVARPLVAVLAGEKWQPAVSVLELYSPALLFFLLLHLCVSLYFTRQRMDAYLRWTVVMNLVLVTSWIVGASISLSGMAAAYVVTIGVLFVPGVRVPLRLIGLPLGDYFRTLRPYMVMTALMAVATALTRFFCEAGGLNDVAVLLLSILAGAVTFGSLAWWRRPAALADLGELLGRRRRPGMDVQVAAQRSTSE